MFARVSLSIVNGQAWGMDVFHLPRRLDRAGPEDLQRFAEDSTREWESQGVAIESFESCPYSARAECTEVRAVVVFRTGAQMRSIQHWIRCGGSKYDGSVWRLSVSIYAEIDPKRFGLEVDALAGSWQPL